MKTKLEQVRMLEHANCLLCGKADNLGLELHIDRTGSYRVSGHAIPSTLLQSYRGELHGGIISLLLDGIMTNCLFAEGIAAVTARLEIRYLLPVEAAQKVELRAHLTKSKGDVHYLESVLVQDGKVMAKGRATFVRRKSE